MASDKSLNDPVDHDLVWPRADALMESLRGTGYSLPDAVADLIDNSITAGARNIWLTFHWAGGDSWVSFLDDGNGMTQEVLVDAMRIGSQSPLEDRSEADLGRYGLGMKTASISQARSLTVASRVSESSQINIRRWDLDYIAECQDWRLLKSSTDTGRPQISALERMDHGTIVLWENMDRFVGDVLVSDQRAQRQFRDSIRSVEEHIAMVFHRLLRGQGFVSISVNEQAVEPWDPYLSDEDATQRLASEELSSTESQIVVEPYILPHHTRLSQEKHSKAGGPAGWNAQQGFYVYRNRRLLLPGDWLGLGYRKEEHYKLARISIDLPNNMDQEWKIDVRKSKASPPLELRDELRRIARVTRDRAVQVYRHRGKTISRSAQASPTFVWQKRVRSQRVSYVINREHPLIKAAIHSDTVDSTTLLSLLRLIEEYIPIQQIWVDAAEGDETQSQPFQSSQSDEIIKMITMLYRAYRFSGLPHTDAMELLSSTEAFGERHELIEIAVGAIKEDGV